MTGERETCIRWLQDQPDGRYEVNRAKKRRSRTQNAYYWSLLAELAGALGVSNDELHFQMLKDYSTPEAFAVMDHVDVSRFFRYYEEVNREGNVVYYRMYKGSSAMDTREFKRLLDGMIAECREVGIETLTPEEVALLKEG